MPLKMTDTALAAGLVMVSCGRNPPIPNPSPTSMYAQSRATGSAAARK